MGYLQEYNTKNGVKTNSSSSGGGYLQQYNSNPPKQTQTQKPTPTPTVQVSQPKVQSKPVAPSNIFQQVASAAQSAVRNITDGLSLVFTQPKIKSPIPDYKPQTMGQNSLSNSLLQIKPGQTKLNQTQLKSINLDSKPMQGAQLKNPSQALSLVQSASNINDKLGGLLYTSTEDRQKLIEGQKVKRTLTRDVGGFIEDAINAYLPFSGGGLIKGARDIVKEGISISGGIKTGAVFAGTTALITALKGEKQSMSDILISGGFGTLLGSFQPKIMTDVSKGAANSAKGVLKTFGFKDKDFKSPEILKTKFKDVVKKLHPDKGGNATEFSKFIDAYNKTTSAGIDSKWTPVEMSQWLGSLWKKTSGAPGAIKQQADAKFKSFIEGIIGNKSVKKGDIKTYLPEGEQTPASIIGAVLKNGLEKTPEGKAVIKAATEAQKTGQNIVVQKQSKVKPSVTPVEQKTATTKPVAPEVSGLAQEAKKYKSAEEFVKAQGTPVYHGTSAKFDKFDPKKRGSAQGFDEPGVSFTTDKESAARYDLRFPRKPRYSWTDADKEAAKNANVVEAYFDKSNPITFDELYKLYADGKIKTAPKSEVNGTGFVRPEQFIDNNRQAIKEASDVTGKKVFKATAEGQTNYMVTDESFIKTKSQLTDIYNQAHQSPTTAKPSGGVVEQGSAKPKEVTVPKEEPKTPDKATEQLKSRVYERLQAENPQALDENVGYTAKTLKDQAEKAVKLIEKDKDKAYRVAMGVEQSNDVLSTSTNIALAEKALADKNYSLYNTLVKNRSFEQTRRGQEIVAEKGSVTDNSTSRYVKELIKMRLEKLGSKYLDNLKLKKESASKRGLKVLDEQVKKRIKKVNQTVEMDLNEAQKFIDSLMCK